MNARKVLQRIGGILLTLVVGLVAGCSTPPQTATAPSVPATVPLTPTSTTTATPTTAPISSPTSVPATPTATMSVDEQIHALLWPTSPAVRLIVGDTLVPGDPWATECTRCPHGDSNGPHYQANPTPDLAPGVPMRIVVDSALATTIRVRVQDWSAPFDDPAATHDIATERAIEGNWTIFTLDPLTNTDDMLLLADIGFGACTEAGACTGNASYSWHLNPALTSDQGAGDEALPAASGVPAAWLIVGTMTVQGTLVSYCLETETVSACAGGLPLRELRSHIATAHLPSGVPVRIMMESARVTDLSSGIQTWSSAALDSSASHAIVAKGIVEGSRTIFTLDPITDTDNTLLYVTASFGQADARYSWHLNPAADPTWTPIRPSQSPDGLQVHPSSARVELGKAYPLQLQTHCGVYEPDFDGSWWQVRNAAQVPPTLGDPFQDGTMTLIDANHARFDFDGGSILFMRHNGPINVLGCD